MMALRSTALVSAFVVVQVVALGLDASRAEATGGETVNGQRVPPNAMFVPPSSFAVIGQSNSTSGSLFRADFTVPFNPTNITSPIFQIFDPSFLPLLLPPDSPSNFEPFIREIARNETFAFAHEAPVFIRRPGLASSGGETNEAGKIAQGTLFFASSHEGPPNSTDTSRNNLVFQLNVGDISSLAPGEFLNPVLVPLPDVIQMTNGGTPFRHKVLLANSGRGDANQSPQRTANLALVDPDPPFNVTILVDNFFGRAFNGLDDVKVLRDGAGGEFVFFTDATYGFLLGEFRPEPLLPNQVYRLDIATGTVRVVADGFNESNGIAFDADGKVAYVTDTGADQGFQGNNQTLPNTIYAFDVEPVTHNFLNRRVFAYVDTGIPDGINVDELGNVYSACGDGVHIWNPSGTLIAKIFLNMKSVNFAFVNDENSSMSGTSSTRGGTTIVILADTSIFAARLAVRGIELDL